MAFNAAPHEQNGVPAFGARKLAAPSGTARVSRDSVLENDLVRAELNGDGHIVSLLDLSTGREVIPPGLLGNVLQLHPDFPNNWPAWDIDRFYRHTHRDIAGPERITVVKSGPDEAAIRVEYAFGASRAVQTLSLAAGSRVLDVDLELDWREHERLLKVALPVDVHADRSTAEIQFGHVERPTHTNTSWDVARFEYVAHRFLHVGEPGFRCRRGQPGYLRPRGYGPRETWRRKGDHGQAHDHTRPSLSRTTGLITGRTASTTGSSPERRSPTPSATGTTSTCLSGWPRPSGSCHPCCNWTTRPSWLRR